MWFHHRIRGILKPQTTQRQISEHQEGVCPLDQAMG